MTILTLTTYALLLVNPSIREKEGIGSVDGFYSQAQNTWSALDTSTACTESERTQVWSSLPSCQPRDVLVTIPFPPDPDLIQFIPSQVELKRCAGTCHQEGQLYHRCSANVTAMQEVPVILEKITGQSTVEVCTTVSMEIHKSCGCGCGEEKCNPLQEFNEKTCSCRCKNAGAMGQCVVQHNKIWDEDRCSCRCRAEEWKECTTGFSYDGLFTCQCLPGPPIIASPVVTVILSVLVLTLAVCVVGLLLMYRRSRDLQRQNLMMRPNAQFFGIDEKQNQGDVDTKLMSELSNSNSVQQ